MDLPRFLPSVITASLESPRRGHQPLLPSRKAIHVSLLPSPVRGRRRAGARPRRCAARCRTRLRRLAVGPAQRGLRRRRQLRRHVAQRLRRAVQPRRRRRGPHRLAGAVLVRGCRRRRRAEPVRRPSPGPSRPAATTWSRRRAGANAGGHRAAHPGRHRHDRHVRHRAARSPCVDASGAVVDLLGWGGAAVAEGSPAAADDQHHLRRRATTPASTPTTTRPTSPASAPTPQNSATPHEDCVAPPPVARPTIAEIQGAATCHRWPASRWPTCRGSSPCSGRRGSGCSRPPPTPTPAPARASTSSPARAPTVAVGDSVTVSGTVSEFRPGGASGNDNTTTTEIVSPAVTHRRVRRRRCRRRSSSGVDRVAPQQTVEAGNPLNVEYDRGDLPPGHRRDRLLRVARGHAGRPAATRRWSARPPSFGEIPVVPGSAVSATRSGTAASSTAATTSPTPRACSSTTRSCRPGRCPPPTSATRSPGETVGVVDYSFSNYKLELTDRADAGLRRPEARGHRAPGPQRAGGRHVQRREPGPERPADEVRPAGRSGRHQPAEPGHPGAGGDPGRQRRHQRRHGRLQPDGRQADGGHPGGRRPGVRGALDQPRRRHRRRRAGRQHPPGVPVPPRPRGRLRRPPRGHRDHAPRSSARGPQGRT